MFARKEKQAQERALRPKSSAGILGLVLVGLCWAETGACQAQEQIQIRGMVLDQSTNEPLNGVSIRLNTSVLTASGGGTERSN